MKYVHLKAIVPQNRDLEGVLRVEVDGVLVKQMRVLARGSAGKGDTSLQHNGNTPIGEYDGSTFIRSGNFDHILRKIRKGDHEASR